MQQPTLTILNTYRLLGSAEDFLAAIGDLARRVESGGHPGILGYRFFVSPTDGAARAVIDYESPAAWIGHHEIAMGWPEMTALHKVARLTEATFLGPFTPEIAEWLRNSALEARIVHGFSYAAGFQRR